MAKKDKKELKNSKDKTSFTKSFKAQLKKVTWPTPKQLFNSTVAVLAIVFVTTIIVSILDITFNSINKYGIDKIKEGVSNSASNEIENESVEETNEDAEISNEVSEENTDTSNGTEIENNTENEE